MRAQEFIPEQQQPVTISIPISITIPQGGGMPEIATIAAPAGEELPDQPVMVPPLQQQIELAKQQGGKSSRVINQILSDNGAASEPEEQDDDQEQETPSAQRNFWSLNEDADVLERIFDRLI